MNTIHSTSKTYKVPYTIVGEKKNNTYHAPYVTILLLNRGGKFYREDLFKNIRNYTFAETIYIEGPDISYNIEPLVKKFPGIKFLLLKDNISDGEKINLGIKESRSVFVFVIWSDMWIAEKSFTEILMNTIGKNSYLCTVPVIENSKHEPIPSIQVPGYMKGTIQVMPWDSYKDFSKSLFPHDFCGIYHKELFEKLGGFDSEMNNPYWQKIDFGFRTFLWGEEIRLCKDLHIRYMGMTHAENITPDESYKKFYIKNIYVKYKNGNGYIPCYKLLHYLFHSNTGPFSSCREFFSIKKWVKENSRRFKNNAQNLISQWEAPE
ncbi:MAG: hypothetical protein JXB88_12820 [Spirochaetales bacterium]|nr:hypothetical protein [Spirochaetales bacterium]